jgi:acyl carrier protein
VVFLDKQTIETKIHDLIKEFAQFNKDNLLLDSDLGDTYGIDSIDLVKILFELENVFQVAVDDHLLTYDNFSTIRKIADFIDGKLHGTDHQSQVVSG